MIKGLTIPFLLLALIATTFGNDASTTALAQTSGLEVQLNSTDHEVDPGQRFGLTAQITNNSSVQQTNVIVKMRVTQNADEVDYHSGSGVAKFSDSATVHDLADSWTTNGQTLGFIPAGQNAIVTWQMDVDDNAPNDEWIQIAFEVWSDQVPGGMLTYKNIHIGDIQAAERHFTLSKTASRDSAAPGDTINYTITVRNDGEAVLDDVLVVDDLPNGNNKWVTYVAGSGKYKIDSTTKNLNDDWINDGFELNFLNRGQTLTMTFSVKVRTDAPHGLVLNNIANVKPRGYDDWAQAAANTTVNVPTVVPITPVVQKKPLPTTGVGDAFIVLWLSAVSSLGGGAFIAGRKMILG